MSRIIAVVCFVLFALQASAQQQQAGNAASTDTDGTFQTLIDACDDVDALMLRARIRLQLPRTTKEAADEAQSMLEQGFATCGGGDLEGAKSQLTEALAVAEAGVSEKFNIEETNQNTQKVALKEVDNASIEEIQKEESEAAPWWKFW